MGLMSAMRQPLHQSGRRREVRGVELHLSFVHSQIPGCGAGVGPLVCAAQQFHKDGVARQSLGWCICVIGEV